VILVLFSKYSDLLFEIAFLPLIDFLLPLNQIPLLHLKRFLNPFIQAQNQNRFLHRQEHLQKLTFQEELFVLAIHKVSFPF